MTDQETAIIAEAEARAASGDTSVEHFDVVVIGAGLTGIYALYRMRELGFRVRAYDDGEGVGGTWYWNRYPGARCDTAVPMYCYSFSDELLQEWDWPEMYASQPVYERYLNFVVDKFDLRRDLQLSSRVGSLIWDEAEHRWDVTLTDGRRSTARFVIAAVGALSAGHLPDIPGIDDFKGVSLHSGHWREGADLEGKRVAVIGTGASGVQIVQEVSKVAGKLVVFQRTPTYCLPLRNHKIYPAAMQVMKAGFRELFRRMAESRTGGTVLPPITTSAFDVSKEERFARYEKVWNEWGHSPENLLWDECFDPGPDGLLDEYSEWLKDKIREQVKDPVVAEKLVPFDHNFGGHRVPGENGYYEAFNRPNVELVSLREDPIERITETGIKTRDRAFDFDVIVHATGWDFGIGDLVAMDIRGRGGLTLKEKFGKALSVHLHLMSHGFPNLYLVSLHDTGFIAPNLEYLVDWIGEQLCYLSARGATQIEPTQEAEDEWTAWATEETFKKPQWEYIVGGNIPGKVRAPYTIVFESEEDLRKRRADLAANGYPGFRIS